MTKSSGRTCGMLYPFLSSVTLKNDILLDSIQPQRVISAILRNTEHKSINGLFVNSAAVEYDDEERTGLAMLMVIISVSYLNLPRLTCFVIPLRLGWSYSSETRPITNLSATSENPEHELSVRRLTNHVLPWYDSVWSDGTTLRDSRCGTNCPSQMGKPGSLVLVNVE